MDRDLKNDISNIWKILLNSKEHFLFSKYLHNPDTQEEADYIFNSRHFKFFRISFWKLCVIDLQKLLSKSEHDYYNLWTFIKNLDANFYQGHNVPRSITNEWRTLLNSKKDTIGKIKILRNKLYAHTDHENEVIKIDITFEEVYDLILIAEKVIKEIYNYSFTSGIRLDAPLFDRSEFDIIKILAKDQKDKIDRLLNWRKPK